MRRHLTTLAVVALLCFAVPSTNAAPATLDILPGTAGPISCSQLLNLAFHFAPGDTTPAIRGYELTIQAGAELTFGVGDITDSGVLAGIGDNFFQITDNDDGTITVTDAILGDTVGLLAAADFFYIDFHGQGTGTGALDILSYKLRDLNNVDIIATSTGSVLVVDCDPPSSSADALGTFQGALTFDVAWTASDAESHLENVELFYDVDGGGYSSYGVFTASPSSFTAASDGVYSFYTVASDSVGNVEADPVTPPDALTTVDTALPAGTMIVNDDDLFSNDLNVTLTSAVTDANPLEMRFDNDGDFGGAEVGWVAYAATSAWTLAAGGDGTRTVYAEYRDGALNVLAQQDDILYDTAAPSAATGLNAQPAHERVELTWTDPGDADLIAIEVWRGLWHDGANASIYPEYDDSLGNTIPTRPATRAAALASAEWLLAGSALPGDEAFSDTLVTRGVYYYEVFPADSALNYSGPVTLTDRATNYWLGDVQVAYDGDVDVGDMTVLGAAFGAEDGEGGYNNECDVGPSDDTTPKGIPQTDDVVDFEDLILFAIHYGTVTPLAPFEGGSKGALLAWREVEQGVWALELLEPCNDLKGIRLSMGIPSGGVLDLIAGDLLDEQGAPTFLRNIDKNGLDVNLAVLGSGETLQGAGEIFRVELANAADLTAVEIIARSSDNSDLPLELGATGVPEAPAAYRFAGNHPNPFNPKTSIRFDLPDAQHVRLDLFDAEGRLVRRLLDETRGPGYHSIVWDGRDGRGSSLASGLYFARIEAGPLRETSKMLLLK